MQRLNKNLVQDYKQYPVKVLQFGEGNFLRAFIDWQVDQMNKKAGFGGGVAVVQPLPKGNVGLLNEQDRLYTLFLQGMQNGKAVREHSIINSISKAVSIYDDYDAFLELAKSETLRFVISNTTEAGIAFNQDDKITDRPPSSYPAKLTLFLYQRFLNFNGAKDKGLIIIPCELIDRNGEKLKNFVLKYAELWGMDEKFKNWINASNTFCCSLVDRIVPGYPKDTIDEVTKELGYIDKAVNVGEIFHLWVIEGPKWISKELPFEKAGLNVKLVDDMTPYRTRKVRILNGAHTTLVPVAYLLGLNTVGESVKDPVAGKFLREAVYNEIIPTLDLPKDELVKFADDVHERFLNPFVKHYLMSIALNSFSKYETRVLPSLLEYLKRKNELPKHLVFSLAAMLKFYNGKRNGEDIPLNDENKVMERMKNLWSSCDGTEGSVASLVHEVLAFEDVWKRDLNEITGLSDSVSKYLAAIDKMGMQKAIKLVL